MPFHAWPEAVTVAFTVVYSLTPWIVDFVLLYRVFAIYPIEEIKRSLSVAIYTFPALIKVVRLSMIIAFAVQFQAIGGITTWRSSIQSIDGAAQGSRVSSPYTKLQIEWVCQICDNAYVPRLDWLCLKFFLANTVSYVSFLFLNKLRKTTRANSGRAVTNSSVGMYSDAPSNIATDFNS